MSDASTGTSGVSGISGLGRAYFRLRYTILFYSLLFTMVAAPASGALKLNASLIEIFLAANLIAAIIPMGDRNQRRVLLVVVLGIAVIMRVAASWIDQAMLSAASLAVWTILALLAAGSALSFALRARS